MASATITPAVGSAVEYANGDGLDKSEDGKFCTGVSVVDPDFGVVPYSGVGINGQASNVHGPRSERFVLDLMYVGDDEESILADWLADSYALADGGPLELSVAGQDIYRCFLDGEASFLDQPTKTGMSGDKCTAKGRLVLDVKEHIEA